ncbi:MAG TPA: ankyrin repeat domain-containing protein [Candidatus Babeliales bacterium]|nr:ankyrin repeat domain-containing protein [Candidatus Babeliales bacterium]
MKINYVHGFLLIIVFNAMSMERMIHIPKNAQDIIEQSQSLDICKYWELEKKWYGLMCATWYGNEKAVENLLRIRALDTRTLYDDCFELQTDRMSISSGETFPRISVSPLALNAYKKNKKIMDLYQADNSLHRMGSEITKETKEKLIHNMCPLYALAAYLGDLDLLKNCIVKKDFNLDYRDAKGGSLLQLAVRGNHEDVVVYLLQFPEIQKNVNQTASLAPVLFIAAQRGYLSIAKLLSQVPGIDINGNYYKYGYGNCISALEIAAEQKQVEMVKFLRDLHLSRGNNGGYQIVRSLPMAIEKENNPALKELLNTYGMDQNLKDQYRKVVIKTVKDEIEKNIRSMRSFDDNLRRLISFLRENGDSEDNQPIMINLNALLGFK